MQLLPALSTSRAREGPEQIVSRLAHHLLPAPKTFRDAALTESMMTLAWQNQVVAPFCQLHQSFAADDALFGRLFLLCSGAAGVAASVAAVTVAAAAAADAAIHVLLLVVVVAAMASRVWTVNVCHSGRVSGACRGRSSGGGRFSDGRRGH